MQRRTARKAFLVVTIVIAGLLMAACSGGDEPATSPGDLIFGDGELPETVPVGFPIPDQAVIGKTLVDRVNSRTEVVVRVAAPIDSVAQYYDVNLVNQGYVISSSTGDTQGWVVEFRRDGLEGTVIITRVEDSITQYSVTFEGS